MAIPFNVNNMIGQPVGVSLADGTGTSGVLCSVTSSQIQLYEYLYQEQYALKTYPVARVQDITTFPHCPIRRIVY